MEAEILDIQEHTPTKEEFQLMLDSYAGNLKKLFNTSGKLYRERGIKDTVGSMSSAEVFELLQAEGMLVKRPFLLTETQGIVGFKEEVWSNTLL